MRKKVDWVFWIQVEKRQWFKKVWKSRGSNFLDIQFFKFHISIGMPWLKTVIEKADVNYPMEGLEHFNRTNIQNKQGIKNHGRFRFIK